MLDVHVLVYNVDITAEPNKSRKSINYTNYVFLKFN